MSKPPPPLRRRTGYLKPNHGHNREHRNRLAAGEAACLGAPPKPAADQSTYATRSDLSRWSILSEMRHAGADLFLRLLLKAADLVELGNHLFQFGLRHHDHAVAIAQHDVARLNGHAAAYDRQADLARAARTQELGVMPRENTGRPTPTMPCCRAPCRRSRWRRRPCSSPSWSRCRQPRPSWRSHLPPQRSHHQARRARVPPVSPDCRRRPFGM